MTASPPPALRVSGLRVPFGAEAGLADVNLAVAPGERLVLVGASGVGKTTLLRAIAGLVPVDAGRVEIGGTEVTHLPPERRGAVYLHQVPVLFPHLSVEENVAFPLRIRGVSRGEIRARVREALAAVRLADLAHRDPGALSGGQRHRVALARAVVAHPALLLLDEPLASLDPELRHEIREVIVHLQARDRPGLVLVTHDLEEAGLLGDRVGIVMGGGIAQLAPPEELFRAPASLEVARFLGYRNEIPCPWNSPSDAPAGSAGEAILHGVARWRGEAPLLGKERGQGVFVLPPGSVRVAMDGDGATLPDAPWIRLTGHLRELVHPGPRPLARVEVVVHEGASVLLEAEAEWARASASSPAPARARGRETAPDEGTRVEVLVDPTRVLRF